MARKRKKIKEAPRPSDAVIQAWVAELKRWSVKATVEEVRAAFEKSFVGEEAHDGTSYIHMFLLQADEVTYVESLDTADREILIGEVKRARIAQLKCPLCGCDELRLIEDVAVFYELDGLGEDGKIRVDNTSRDESEMAHNHRLACWDSGCMATFPLPESMEIEWTDGEAADG
jgi:hypothetical protein